MKDREKKEERKKERENERKTKEEERKRNQPVLCLRAGFPESFSCTSSQHYLKGTVSRDFFALVFFLNLFILVLLEMP